MLVVTYKQHQSDGDEDEYVEHTDIFSTWEFQKKLEKCKQEGNPMIVTGMWCWQFNQHNKISKGEMPHFCEVVEVRHYYFRYLNL